MPLKDFLNKTRRSFGGALAAGALVVGAVSTDAAEPKPKPAMPQKIPAKIPAYSTVQKAIKKIDNLCFRGIKDKLEKREGNIAHLYLDRNGLLHTGVGINVNDYANFKMLEFKDKNGKLLTEKQKKALFVQAKAFQMKQAKKGFNFSAKYYANKFAYAPTKESRDMLFALNITKSMTDIKQMLGEKNYYNLHLNAQEELIGLHFNLGAGKFNPKKFKKLFAAAQKQDYQTMAKESHVKGVAEHRNQLVYNAFAGCTQLRWAPFGTWHDHYKTSQMLAYQTKGLSK